MVGTPAAVLCGCGDAADGWAGSEDGNSNNMAARARVGADLHKDNQKLPTPNSFCVWSVSVVAIDCEAKRGNDQLWF
tara:strand:+ start:273 stop:503 length:231 start_codon:yes stop_codon:yes gene_type:complete